MSSIAVVGMQWGDEGKGKVIDLLSEQAQHIARAQGGNNAGHTIIAQGKEYRFHLVPSGIIYPHSQCYIGGGTVIDPGAFLSELQELEKNRIAFADRLLISPYAHVVMPYHRVLDRLSEKAKGDKAVGTTGRGIGPCYSDKVNRCGIRLADLCDQAAFRGKLESALTWKNEEMGRFYGHDSLIFDAIYDEYQGYAQKIAPLLGPVEELLYKALRKKEKVLFEGAQGALLDVTFGTYPFVTSSCTLAGGICSGLGVGPSLVEQTIGVAKAYTTRVGNGPMPTELKAEELSLFPEHSSARELGTTTGRKRRIGWLDTFLLRHTAALNGIDFLGVTKLDILDGLPEIKICTGYKRHAHFPVAEHELCDAQPIYETHVGWMQSTRDIVHYRDLPKNAKAYLRRIEELCEVSIGLVSVGPDREKTIWLERFFE